MCEMMSKASKEALTVLIVTHVAHVERVERNFNSFNCYSCYSCQKGQKWCFNNFLNIQWIFNPKKVLECWDSGLSNHTLEFYVHWSMSKGSKVEITFDPFNTLRHTWDLVVWLESSKSKLLKTFFGLKIHWILRKLLVRMLWTHTAYFGGLEV